MQSAMRLHLRPRARHAYLSHGLASCPRSLSTSSRCQDYARTLPNLRIGSKTRVIFQGFTGRQATINAQESIAWGTNIVGGVTPGREGEHLGLPVLPTLRRAVDELKPDATAIYVPAPQAPAAIEEAIAAEIPLIVAVAEHVPLHDMLRIHDVLRTQTRSRLVGPNSPGIISAAAGERCRIGFQPLPYFSAGCVGIAAKSGTLSYEAVASTTRAGLGQSLVVGVGGDVLPGTDLVEALQVLVADPATRAIALIGEIGGDGEVLAAQWIQEYHARTPEAERKPIAALVAGRYSPRDRVMGHAGAFWLPGEPEPNLKGQALQQARVTLVNHPDKFGAALSALLKAKDASAGESTGESTDTALSKNPQQQQQVRGFHTSTRGLFTPSRPMASSSASPIRPQQFRSLHLDRESCADFYKKEFLGARLRFTHYPHIYISLGIDRSTRAQCITSSYVVKPESMRKPTIFNKILLPMGTTDITKLEEAEWNSVIHTLALNLKLDEAPYKEMSISYRKALTSIIFDMASAFRSTEAKVVAVQLSPIINHKEPFYVLDMRIEADDAAYRSAGRAALLHKFYGKREARDPGAVDAEAHGIVYHRLMPNDGAHDIGTIVNGAGLAMNTIDAMWDLGGRATNFLDTGGKATTDTVRRSFEVVLLDPRVRVVFVNIFGGLTRGDMIAEGVIAAVRELGLPVPVVVRIRGTNEVEAREVIAGCGLPSLFAFDDFEEAAKKAIEIAAAAKTREQAANREARLEERARRRAETLAEEEGAGAKPGELPKEQLEEQSEEKTSEEKPRT